ncbi:hypothetical protein KFU94_64625 [Chloroflexi bacterium TSY]|nr:hypothetical protein [Chloroflexi bacterium TSY]
MSGIDNSPGRIIFLNVAPCSGETILARTLQETPDESYLHVSVDHVGSG